jgi:DNA-binding CsgD family transcriptional regulator
MSTLIRRGLPTARQQEIIGWTWFGLTNGEIAARLCVGEHTVDNHLWHAHRRLGLAGARGSHEARVRAAVWLWRMAARQAGWEAGGR